jgi:gentisate 1,2-dioxygenase
MSEPVINIGCCGNIFSRQMHFLKAGDIEYGHTHHFDHMTLLAKGSLEVTVDGKKSIFTAPQMIWIKSDKKHELVALEDNTVAYCIHGLRDLELSGEIVTPDMIPAGSLPMKIISQTVTKE